MFKAITFDLWNTLLDGTLDHGASRVDLLYDVCTNAGCFREKSVVEAAYREASSRLFAQPSSKATTASLVRHILEVIKVNFTGEVKERLVKGFEDAILADPPGLLDDAQDVLQKLHRQYKIGLVCNTGVTPGRALRQVLKHRGVLKYFTYLAFSNEVGVAKPDPMIFRKALECLHASPAESVHVGDLLETDVAGAKRSGMSAIWVNRGEEKADKQLSKCIPDFEIKTLNCLLGIL